MRDKIELEAAAPVGRHEISERFMAPFYSGLRISSTKAMSRPQGNISTHRLHAGRREHEWDGVSGNLQRANNWITKMKTTTRSMKQNLTRGRWIAAAAILALCGFLGNNAFAGGGVGPAPLCTKKYAFYPQGGNFFSDLYPINFTDLDAGAGILDFRCSDYTLDGHIGIDSIIDGGFTAQAIGVPVFAVLDGVVLDTHDGEDDTHTAPGPFQTNFIRIDHGGGHITSYSALKRNSITVSASQTVTAGQQIALTGSSGSSFRPHLNFSSEVNGVTFEPFAGGCRGGESNWIKQPAFRSELYVRQFVITSEDLTGWPGPTTDTTRTGTYVVGNRAVNFWFVVGNGQGVQNVSMRYLRPDNSQRLAISPINVTAARNAFYAFNIGIDLDVPGTWHLEVSINGQVVTSAPFMVIPSGAPVNRPPAAVQTVFDPPAPVASDVLFCRINSNTLYLDPDYNFVRYRYLWQVNGVTVRDVTTAGLADAIPRDTAQTDNTITCTVTPSDGIENGPPTALSVQVRARADVSDRLLNISTRLRVQTGDNVLIGGFILTGTDPKRVIIRAIGPSLGIPGALGDTKLELRDGSGLLLAENDNWKDTQQAEIEATLIPPSNDLESAIVATLPANNANYTAIVRGKDNTTGIGLVEVYDLGPGANSKMANISTRGVVETGNNVLIGGFIIGNVNHGGGRVVVRAIGPSLGNVGVANPLLDPILEIHDSNGVLLSINDDWRQCQQTEIQATGLQPSDDRESTLLVTLAPGAYTGIILGKNNTTGVAVVEVYNLQ
jgi:hypothetical protein